MNVLSRKQAFDQAMEALVEDKSVLDYVSFMAAARDAHKKCFPHDNFPPECGFARLIPPWNIRFHENRGGGNHDGKAPYRVLSDGVVSLLKDAIETTAKASPAEFSEPPKWLGQPVHRLHEAINKADTHSTIRTLDYSLESLCCFLRDMTSPPAGRGRPVEFGRDLALRQVMDICRWQLGLDPIRHQAKVLAILESMQCWMRNEGGEKRPFSQLSRRRLKDLIARYVADEVNGEADVWLSEAEREALAVNLDETTVTLLAMKCQECADVLEFPNNPGIKRANKAAREDGWLIDSKNQKKLCPKCKEGFMYKIKPTQKPSSDHPYRRDATVR